MKARHSTTSVNRPASPDSLQHYVSQYMAPFITQQKQQRQDQQQQQERQQEPQQRRQQAARSPAAAAVSTSRAAVAAADPTAARFRSPPPLVIPQGASPTQQLQSDSEPLYAMHQGPACLPSFLHPSRLPRPLSPCSSPLSAHTRSGAGAPSSSAVRPMGERHEQGRGRYTTVHSSAHTEEQQPQGWPLSDSPLAQARSQVKQLQISNRPRPPGPMPPASMVHAPDLANSPQARPGARERIKSYLQSQSHVNSQKGRP